MSDAAYDKEKKIKHLQERDERKKQYEGLYWIVMREGAISGVSY